MGNRARYLISGLHNNTCLCTPVHTRMFMCTHMCAHALVNSFCYGSYYYAFVCNISRTEQCIASLKQLLNLYLSLSVCMCVWQSGWSMSPVWRSEDNLWEPILSFYCVSLRDQTQVVRLGGKRLSLLSHLTGSLSRLSSCWPAFDASLWVV